MVNKHESTTTCIVHTLRDTHHTQTVGTNRKMKTAIIIICAVIGTVIIVIRQFQKRSIQINDVDANIPADIYSINDGNQDSLIYFVDYDKEWLDELDKKYSWEDFGPYDNRYFEYMYKLFDELSKQSPEGESNAEFFNKLTRGQKIFYSMLVFGGQVDNGGVYQFFFNNPEFALAVLESLEELELDILKTDYEKCIQELLGTVDKLKARRESFNDDTEDWEKRWKSFSGGYSELPSAQVIEDYFYKEENKKMRYKRMVEYIDNHLELFVKK